MEKQMAIYKKLKRDQTSWMLVVGCSFIPIALVVGFTVSKEFTFLLFLLLAVTIFGEIFGIIKLAKTSKAIDEIGLEMANMLTPKCYNQKDLQAELVNIGIPRNFALNYAIRVKGPKRDTDTTTQQTVNVAPVEIKCPKCNMEKVHWIPYEKTSHGSFFYIWLILSALGYTFSTIVTVIMFILGVVSLITRIIEGRVEKKVNCYQCDMCGHKFEVLKNE